MILEKEQIQRYLRHILMPEISGPGQKKLLEASIIIHCHKVSDAAFMLYYLAAMGIGKISCITEDKTDCESTALHIHKLNPEIILDISDSYDKQAVGSFDAGIVFDARQGIPELDTAAIPVICAGTCGDLGFIKTYSKEEGFKSAYREANEFYINHMSNSDISLFNKASFGLAGALAAIQTVKILLNIGSMLENSLEFDLATYEFEYGKSIRPIVSRKFDGNAVKEMLKNAKVLIVGSGGLGSPVSYMLAAMGIGELGLVDYDVVEISNLNRQILHTTANIGKAKVKSAEEFLKLVNPNLTIQPYAEKFTIENAQALIQNYDIIVDGLDNLPARYLLNDACYFAKKPLVEAGVLCFDGLATMIMPDKGPCYRCTFPESEKDSHIPACSETGVLGAVPGVMGVIQAIEAIKHLTGFGTPLINKILLFDAMKLDITVLDLFKEPDCALCGDKPTILELKEKIFECKK